MTDPDENDNVTASKDIRWTYLGSFLAVWVVGTFCLMILLATLGYGDLGAIPHSWFYLLFGVVMTATAWVFGADLAKDYATYKKN